MISSVPFELYRVNYEQLIVSAHTSASFFSHTLLEKYRTMMVSQAKIALLISSQAEATAFFSHPFPTSIIELQRITMNFVYALRAAENDPQIMGTSFYKKQLLLSVYLLVNRLISKPIVGSFRDEWGQRLIAMNQLDLTQEHPNLAFLREWIQYNIREIAHRRTAGAISSANPHAQESIKKE